MSTVLREVFYFVVIFALLSLSFHMDRWLSAPLSHFEHLLTHIFPLHPLVYSGIGYFIILTLRGILKGIRSIF